MACKLIRPAARAQNQLQDSSKSRLISFVLLEEEGAEAWIVRRLAAAVLSGCRSSARRPTQQLVREKWRGDGLKGLGKGLVSCSKNSGSV